MNKFYAVVFFSMLGFAATAQPGTIKGRLVDSTYREVLSEATVSVLHIADSTPITFAVADKKGSFEIKNLDTGTFRMLISFSGYRSLSKIFALTSDNPIKDFGTLYMDKEGVMLEEVVVERPPITIKKDTVEFNASSFKTKPNATAEDLLKKIPGVQVDKEGNVKAQGEDIQKVYVDGKEFFGTDPKLATKNITADMIESVQVFDDMSDQAKFTRIDDGSRSKTINIKLKKDKRKGYFGRAVAGIGTNDRFESSIMFNKFDGDRRISFLGGANNLNKQAFSFNDIVSTMGGFGSRGGGGGGGFGGGGGGFGGGGNRGGGGGNISFSTFGGPSTSNGITRSISSGINYTDKYFGKVDLTGSYFYSNTDNHKESESVRQSFFANDSVTYQNQRSLSANKNENHRFNLRVEYAIDSMNSVLFTPSVTRQHSSSSSLDSIRTRATKPGLDYLALNGVTRNDNMRDGLNFNNNVLFRHKFFKPGRTITFGWNNSINNSDGQGINYAPYIFYNPDSSVARISSQDLKTFQSTRSNNNVLSTSYTEPLGLNKILEFNYAYTFNRSTSDRKGFDHDPSTGKYDKVNASQTNYFDNDYKVNRFGTNFRVQTTKYNFQLGMGVQLSEQDNYSRRKRVNLPDTITNTHQEFTNFYPTANFNYNFNKTKSLRFNYRGRTNQPNISQLQDVPDFSDPLYVRTGNPKLRPEFSNTLSLIYNSFNPATFKFISANIRFENTSNEIVNSVDTLGHGVQLLRPVNMNGAYNTSSFITLGIPLRKLKGSNINFNNSINFSRNLSMLNRQKNVLTNLIVTQTAGINLDVKQKWNIGLNASVAYNDVKYSVQESLNSKYFTQTYSFDLTYTTKKNTVFSSDFDYYLNTGRTDGYNQSLPLWNASVAQQIFKKKNGEIKFSVNDILNQNQSITRSVSENYIVDTRTVVLKRYFMLTFTYNLNKAGAQNQRGNMPAGAPKMMIRRFGD